MEAAKRIEIGKRCHRIAMFPEAERQLKISYNLLRNALGPKSRQTLEAAATYGLFLADMRRSGEAEPLCATS
jgi:hypothetical protein